MLAIIVIFGQINWMKPSGAINIKPCVESFNKLFLSPYANISKSCHFPFNITSQFNVLHILAHVNKTCHLPGQLPSPLSSAFVNDSSCLHVWKILSSYLFLYSLLQFFLHWPLVLKFLLFFPFLKTLWDLPMEINNNS